MQNTLVRGGGRGNGQPGKKMKLGKRGKKKGGKLH